MTPEEKNLLKEAVNLAKENQKILKKLHRAHILGRAVKIFYWVIIIGVGVGAFYFLQPYIDSLKGAFGGARDTIDNVQKVLQTVGE